MNSKSKLSLVLLASVTFASACAAQGAAPAAPVVTLPSAAASTMPLLRQGTEIRFQTQQALSSKTTKEGDRFELRSVDPIYVGSLMVIPAGSRGVGEVTRVVKKGAFGKSGKLDTRILFVVVGETHVALTGKSNDQGSSGTVGTVAAAVLFWPAMPFITGTSAEFPIGTAMSAFVENDLPLMAAAAAPLAPLVVPVAAAPNAAAVVPVAPATPVAAAKPVAPLPMIPAPVGSAAKPVAPVTR